MGIFSRKNYQASYIDLHNMAVIRYRRACRAFIWAGVVNQMGLTIGIIQYFVQGRDWMPFYLCFGVCDFTFLMLFPIMGISSPWFWIIVAVLLTATTAGAVLLGVFSSQGKKSFLLTMLIAYFVDWIMVFLAHFIAGEDLLGLMINAGVHVVVSFFIIMAVYQYYNVLNIEKRFKDIPTVAEVKAREAEEKEKEENDNGDQ